MARHYITPGSRTLDLIHRAKRFVETHHAERIRLIDTARAVGVSPAYLTATFRRCEGVPLHRYLTRLRLERARVALPQTNDLTVLALDVGFSSHSHFTAAFRKLFGCTPSQYRAAARNGCSRRMTP